MNCAARSTRTRRRDMPNSENEKRRATAWRQRRPPTHQLNPIDLWHTIPCWSTRTTWNAWRLTSLSTSNACSVGAFLPRRSPIGSTMWRSTAACCPQKAKHRPPTTRFGCISFIDPKPRSCKTSRPRTSPMKSTARLLPTGWANSRSRHLPSNRWWTTTI